MSIELLRMVTAGSVDDGKSTLIGRLLHDTRALLDDQLEAIEKVSARNGYGYTNLALATDGLRAEREQGITIDVAYRYFATPRRKFVLVDSPGHVQYTRNMVTGASSADLAALLVDARRGVAEQTRRHALIASLLGIRNLVLCVNKMDRMDFDREAFERIRAEFESLAAPLEIPNIRCIPMSALQGDNVVERSARMPWYAGPTLLEAIETAPVGDERARGPARLPVQLVIRPHAEEWHDFRSYAGRVESGTFFAGDEIQVLPSGLRSRVARILDGGGRDTAGEAGRSVSITLTDALDVGRGDTLVKADRPPITGRELELQVCWMNERKLAPGTRYGIRHATRFTQGLVSEILSRTDLETFRASGPVAELGLNEIGRVRLRVAEPLVFDPYAESRAMGSLLLIDERTHETVGAGMIIGPAEETS